MPLVVNWQTALEITIDNPQEFIALWHKTVIFTV